MKPDFISYYKSQYSFNSNFIVCQKTGIKYQEINRKTHRIVEKVIQVLLLLSCPIVPRLVQNSWLLSYLLLLNLVLLSAFFLAWPIFIYRISKFNIVEENKAEEGLLAQ